MEKKKFAQISTRVLPSLLLTRNLSSFYVQLALYALDLAQVLGNVFLPERVAVQVTAPI